MYLGSLNESFGSIPFKPQSGASCSGHNSLHLLVRFQLNLELEAKIRLSQRGSGFFPACFHDDGFRIKMNWTVGGKNNRTKQSCRKSLHVHY